VHYSLILAFASVMICPLIYYVLIVAWQPRGVRARVQYLLGLSIYFFLGPFLNITVLLYALWSLDNFGWGKTRKVVETVQILPGSEKVNDKRPRHVAGRNKIRKSPPRSIQDSRFQDLAAEESMVHTGF
jgi:Chitin synthase